MRVINLNPDTEIGASAWAIEIDGHRLLLDAGTHPKREGRASLPLYDVVAKQDMAAVIISHCHHDHVGSLPVAMRYFPQAHVLLSELSYFLVERVLHNSVNVMIRQRDELGIREYPLYSHGEVDDIAHLFTGCKYNREIDFALPGRSSKQFPSPTVEFYDAGHALGSAGILVRGQKETLFYTGDVSFGDQTILKGARFEEVSADVMIMETTRGNREVPPNFSREAETERLTQAMLQVLERKGSIMIPVFALGRTQEILAMLALQMGTGRLPRQPIYIGGLGRVFTEIYDLEAHRAHRQHSQLKLTEALNLIVLDKEQTEKMRVGGGRIFVVTAGMMSEKTAAHELATRMIEDPNQAIFFVGYADPDTPGGRLRAAQQDTKFFFSPSAGEFVKRCQVEEFDLTAHANRDELLGFIEQVAPRAIFLGHGETDSRKWFEEQIRVRYPKIRVIQPTPGLTVEV